MLVEKGERLSTGGDKVLTFVVSTIYYLDQYIDDNY